MAATASPYLRQETSSSTWILVAIALVGFGGACGVMLAYGEIEAFYISMSLLVAIAVLADFRIGAVLLVLMLPLQATHLFPHQLMGVPGLNPLNMLLGATLLSAAMRRQLGGLLPRQLLLLYMLPVLGAGLIGLQYWHLILDYFFETQTVNFSSGFGYFREMAVRPLLMVLVVLVVGLAAARSQKPERFFTPIIISVWIIALIEIGFIAASGVHLGWLTSAGARRFFDEIGLHANDLGRMFAVAYALLLFVWWETKDAKLKSTLFFTLGIATLGMVLSFSRGGLFGFFLVNALFLVWKFNAKTLALALSAGAIASLLAPVYVWNRITFGFDDGANAVSADRIEGIWLPLLPELLKSPILGNGLGSVMWVTPMQLGEMLPVGHPHNAFLEAVLDMGVVGLALMLAYFWHVWKGFRFLGSNPYLSAEMRGLFQGAAAALICFLVTGMSGSSFRPEAEFIYLWLAIGLMYGMLARRPATG
jgi:O-antigen ligase